VFDLPDDTGDEQLRDGLEPASKPVAAGRKKSSSYRFAFSNRETVKSQADAKEPSVASSGGGRVSMGVRASTGTDKETPANKQFGATQPASTFKSGRFGRIPTTQTSQRSLVPEDTKSQKQTRV